MFIIHSQNKQGGRCIEHQSASDLNDTFEGSIAMTESILSSSVLKNQEPKNIKRVSDEVIISAYSELKNVWKVGERVGLCGQYVHARLKSLNLIIPMNIFSEKEKKILVEEYTEYRNKGKLQELANKLGRTKQFICRQAKKLGLTDLCHDKSYFYKYDGNQYFHNHGTVRRKRGTPSYCEICGSYNDASKFYEWANLTGKYDDINDYKRMCRNCHRKYDKNNENNRGKTTKYQKQEIIEMVKIGIPYHEISKLYGITTGAVSYLAISRGHRRVLKKNTAITISKI